MHCTLACSLFDDDHESLVFVLCVRYRYKPYWARWNKEEKGLAPSFLGDKDKEFNVSVDFACSKPFVFPQVRAVVPSPH